MVIKSIHLKILPKDSSNNHKGLITFQFQQPCTKNGMVEKQVTYHTEHLVIASFLSNRLQSFILQIGLHALINKFMVGVSTSKWTQ
jgi:hypothetical protein